MADLQYLAERDAQRGDDEMDLDMDMDMDMATSSDSTQYLYDDIVYHIAHSSGDREGMYNWLLVNGYVAMGPPKGPGGSITEEQESRYAEEQERGLKTGEIYPEFKKKYMQLVVQEARRVAKTLPVISSKMAHMFRFPRGSEFRKPVNAQLDKLEEIVKKYPFQSLGKDLLVRLGGDLAFIDFIEKNADIASTLQDWPANVYGITYNYFNLKTKHSKEVLEVIASVVYARFFFETRYGDSAITHPNRDNEGYFYTDPEDVHSFFDYEIEEVYQVMFMIFDVFTNWNFADNIQALDMEGELNMNHPDVGKPDYCMKFLYDYIPRDPGEKNKETYMPGAYITYYPYYVYFAHKMLDFNAAYMNAGPSMDRKLYSPDQIAIVAGKALTYALAERNGTEVTIELPPRILNITNLEDGSPEYFLEEKMDSLYQRMCNSLTYTEYMCRNATTYNIKMNVANFPDYAMYPVLLAWSRRQDSLEGRKEYPEAIKWRKEIINVVKIKLAKRESDFASSRYWEDFQYCKELVKELSD